MKPHAALIALALLPVASGAYAQDIVVNAQSIAASAVHGSWAKQADPSAADGTRLGTPDAGFSATASALASPVDYVDMTFDAPAGVAYHVWFRLRAVADSKWNDSIWVQFSDALVGGAHAYATSSADALLVNLENCSGCGVSGWGWQDRAWWLSQSAVVSFASTGQHTLRVQVREDGVAFDQIVLSPSRYMSAPPPAGAVTTPATATADNLAIGRPAVASSIENSAYTAARAVDGDPSTRWSSQFSDPQWMYVDLGQAVSVTGVNLEWETAYATAYDIQVSADTQTWQTLYTQNSGTGGSEHITGISGVGRYIRVLGRQRATPWGYSLFELQVFGTPATTENATSLATGRPAAASSIESASYAASNSVDGNIATRWSSQFSDPQWLAIDLGAAAQVTRVVLRWETAFASAYQIQMSDDAQAWTTIFATTAGDGGVDDLAGLNGTGRYVRVFGTARGTPWGYSLWELEVYGTAGVTPPPPPPSAGMPPEVHLVAPANGDRYSEPAGVWLSANAADADGIARVDFYADGQLIGSDTTMPYQMLWQNAPRGAHQLVAVAMDGAGASASSETVNLGVNPFGALNVARGRPVWASTAAGADVAAAAVDGSAATAWSSAAGGTQTLSLDLGATIGVDRFVLRWAPGAHASSYQIVYSTNRDFTDGGPFQGTVITNGDGDIDTIQLPGVPFVRYLRIVATAGPSPSGYSLDEFEVYRTLQLTQPAAPEVTNPANGSTGNRRDPALDWSAPYAAVSDLYFGTSNPPPLVAANLSNPSFRFFALAADTTYYWQVVARSDAGSVTGPVWSFRTGGGATGTSPNLALNRRASASSETGGAPALAAVDGSYSTRWTSASSDAEWIAVDLASGYTIDRIVLGWDTAFAAKYDVQVSPDGFAWTTVFSNDAGSGGVETIPLGGVSARLVRIVGRQRAAAGGYSLNEIEVYGR